MKKKIALIFLLVLSLALILTAVGCAAGKNENGGSQETRTFDDPADQISWDLYAEKAAKYGKTVGSAPKKDLYESSYDVATEEQREKLDALYEKYECLLWEHEREIKIIMGELPEDTPRLTREEAAEICRTMEVKDFRSPEEFEEYVAGLFDEIAGAPDLNGGLGISYHTYYLDDSQEIAVRIAGGVVEYWDKTNGESEILLRLLDLMG